MSDTEMEDVARSIKATEQNEILRVFLSNADYFSANNKHHTKYISKLFRYFNKYFVMLQKFEKEDENCEECVNTIIKFWSTILFDIWQKEIV